MKRLLKRLYHASSGIIDALRYDHSVRVHIILAIIIVPIVLWLLWPLATWELLLLLLGGFLILITEIQNSALESALDRLHPELHDNIKRSKDMAAGAVLLSGLYGAIVIGVLLLTRILG